MNRYPKFDDKSILIWGYGREGQSTERFLNSCCNPRKVRIFEGKKEEIREEELQETLKGLKAAEGYLRSMLAKNLNLRNLSILGLIWLYFLIFSWRLKKNLPNCMNSIMTF